MLRSKNSDEKRQILVKTSFFGIGLTEKASLVFVLDAGVDEDGDGERVVQVQGPPHLPDASDERAAAAVLVVPMFGGCRVELLAKLPPADSTMDH